MPRHRWIWVAAYALLLASSWLWQEWSAPDASSGFPTHSTGDIGTPAGAAPPGRGEPATHVETSTDGGAPPAGPTLRRKIASLRAFDSEGPLRGRTVRIAWREWTPVKVSTDRPPLVLLHGSPGASEDLAPTGRRFAEAGYRVLIPDLLCSAGASERSAPDCGALAQARTLDRWLENLGEDRVRIFAHSYGSGVALFLADLAPPRVEAQILYGGIGVQETEGSGDYYIEHTKYALGLALIGYAPALLPHFGLLGEREVRVGFMRQFADLDQRPLREIMQSLETPTLILHGAEDPLVPAWGAELHHELLPRSDLVILDASHFLVFSEDGSERLAREGLEFFDRLREKRNEGRAETDGAWQAHVRRDSEAHRAKTRLPVNLAIDPATAGRAKFFALIAATFVSEDLTCVSAGLLIRANKLDYFTGVFACFVGIFLGDLGLYMMGRGIGAGLLSSQRFRRLLPPGGLERLQRRFDREGWKLIFAARFLPGARFPVYVGAGVLGGRAGRLMLIALIAGLIWTPLLVTLAALLGPLVLAPFEWLTGGGWLALIPALLVLILALRMLGLTLTRAGRRRIALGFARWMRPEFWPAWLFYAPLIPYCAWLHLRYGGFRTVTAANPGLPEGGGFIGESKSEILQLLPDRFTLAWRLIPAANTEARAPANRKDAAPFARAEQRAEARIETAIRLAQELAQSINRPVYPVICKPDVAEKGKGLKLLKSEAELRAYVRAVPDALILQAYHPGPCEAGVFYMRMPGETRGFIFSITDKEFPALQGDGRRSLEDLIVEHPRYRLQAERFLERHADRLDWIPPAGERVSLGLAGNHFQGCVFRDGDHLRTPALEAKIDALSQEIDGFYFGRFDLRYSDPEAFVRGEELAIVELNGATAEATNIYTPDASLRYIYGYLFRQWDWLFRIGHTNRLRGARPLANRELLAALFAYPGARKAPTLGD